MFCPECGNQVGDEAAFCAVCGSSQGRQAAGLRYASFPRRMLAWFVDLLIMSPFILTIAGLTMTPPTVEERDVISRAQQGTVTPSEVDAVRLRAFNQWGGLVAIAFFVGWPYFTIMEASARQGTVGKIVTGLRVADTAGKRIGWGRSNLRYWGRWISAFPACTGFLLPLITARKQTLHDMMSRCVVVQA